MAEDFLDDFEAVPDNVIPFPAMRANAKLAEAWARERDARNEKNRTRHRFIGPLDAVDGIMARRLLPSLSFPAAWVGLSRRARLVAGQCMGVVGPQGGGKTSFAIQVAIANTGQGIPVIWVALELDEVEITERIIANMHGVHTMAVHDHWPRERIAHSAAAVHDMWKFVERDPDPSRTLAALADAISLVKAVYRIAPVVVIDYLGKLASMANDLRQATIQAAEQLRAAAVAEMCYVMILAQPSRANNQLLTGKTDLDSATDAIAVAGESAEIEGACAVMIGLNVFKVDDAQELDAHILVPKARNTGLEGREGFKFSKPGGVWHELDYLPATPGSVKAAHEAEKKDKHRSAPARSIAEVRDELNMSRRDDSDTARRVAVLAAIKRTGAYGMTGTEIRGARAAGRGGGGRVLQELESAGLIEKMSADRWRVIARIP